MQRKLIMNTALCATICSAINTRNLIASEALESFFDDNFHIEGLAQTGTKMLTTAEVLSNANGLAQVQGVAEDAAQAASDAIDDQVAAETAKNSMAASLAYI